MSCLGTIATDAGDGRWHLGVGDPTWVGWLAVVAYGWAAWLCLRASRAQAGADPAARRLRVFWLLVSALLLALGVNKQLDLQTLAIELLRDLSRAQGWYEERQRYQQGFVLALGAGSVLGLGALAVGLWPVRRRVRLALAGLGTLLAFVLLSAAFFQHVGPAWLAATAPLHAWLELAGLGLLGWAASRARPPKA